MNNSNSTISINIPNPMVGIQKIKNFILNFADNFYNGPIRHRTNYSKNIFSSLKNPFKNFKLPKFNKKLLIKIALPALVVVIFLFGAFSILRNINTTSADPEQTSEEGVSIPPPVATENIDRSFNFSLTDEEGENLESFDYEIQDAELRKQIVVQGQRATSINGRVFLILNLKITNNLDQSISLRTRDYIRVILNNNEEELIAPDIHNDPVEVQAISTKYTRLGLAINESDVENPIVLQVGEIDGEKQTIELNFN